MPGFEFICDPLTACVVSGSAGDLTLSCAAIVGLGMGVLGVGAAPPWLLLDCFLSLYRARNSSVSKAGFMSVWVGRLADELEADWTGALGRGMGLLEDGFPPMDVDGD